MGPGVAIEQAAITQHTGNVVGLDCKDSWQPTCMMKSVETFVDWQSVSIGHGMARLPVKSNNKGVQLQGKSDRAERRFRFTI